jgi:hypothetical protein
MAQRSTTKRRLDRHCGMTRCSMCSAGPAVGQMCFCAVPNRRTYCALGAGEAPRHVHVHSHVHDVLEVSGSSQRVMAIAHLNYSCG